MTSRIGLHAVVVLLALASSSASWAGTMDWATVTVTVHVEPSLCLTKFQAITTGDWSRNSRRITAGDVRAKVRLETDDGVIETGEEGRAQPPPAQRVTWLDGGRRDPYDTLQRQKFYVWVVLPG